MSISRRDFVRFAAGTGALAALGQLGRMSAIAGPTSNYRAMVGVFLFGGNDGWNMVIPTDARHSAYMAARGSVGIRADALTPLSGKPFALHPAMAALSPVWDEGGLGVVLNTGTLYAPLSKANYNSKPELRPSNLMSHADEQAHWQGMRARGVSVDGFLGRIADRTPQPTTPTVISFGGSNLAVLGKSVSPLVLPSGGTLSRAGYGDSSSSANAAKNAAIAAFANGAGRGAISETVGRELNAAYSLAASSSSLLAGTSSTDAAFVDPATGAALTSDIARQLMRVARMIQARGTLGHDRQTFFVSHGGYDTHAGQVTDNAGGGKHGALLRDLALALAGFYRAMQSIGLGQNVTAFTMSDFGRTYKSNGQSGTDHAWGNNHLVVGGDLAPQTIHGAYPDPVLGGADDIRSDGRFIPTLAQEEYVGAIARWHGVSDADLPYIFPNWATWSGGGRGPLGLFRP